MIETVRQVILLRLHEEMGESDEQCHYFGSARILNSISSFAADGGLRESANWISLRQHITVSLMKQQLLDLDLSNYRFSRAFTPVQSTTSLGRTRSYSTLPKSYSRLSQRAKEKS